MSSQNNGQGSITLGVLSLGRFSKFKMHFLNNFYVCDPTSLKLIPHLVSEVRKVYWQNGGQGPITLEFCPAIGFQILPFLKIFVTVFSGI